MIAGDLVLAACLDGFLYAIDRDSGARIWSLDCGGRIQFDPLVAGRLAFLAVDDQRMLDGYDGSKLRKRFVVVDLDEREVVHSWAGDIEWAHDVIATDEQVFFHDRRQLWVYDVARREVAYRITPPSGVWPSPVLTGDTVLLPIRIGKAWCQSVARPEEPRPIGVYDRRTGRELGVRPDGGVSAQLSAGQLHLIQEADVLLVVSGDLAAYRLVAE